MEPIRILHVVPNMQSGGLENLIMNIYRNIDREKVQFDFLVHYNKHFHFDEEIEKLGGKIYRFPVMEDYNVFAYKKNLKEFFSKHKEYKIIHGHMASLAFLYLGLAKKAGIKVRILHSHGTSHLKSLKGYAKWFLFKFGKYQSTHNFACSTEAGNYLFKKQEYELIPNAIDISKYKFDDCQRKKYRKEFDLQDFFVIGHIGRFNLQKNHTFILKVFKEVYKKDKNVMLLLIGDGELLEQVKKEAIELQIDSNVRFLGVRQDANKLYNAMDLFVLPSLFEGLPLVGVEAQANGLSCLFSNTITKETNLTDLVCNLPLDDISIWADKILEYKRVKKDRKLYYEKVGNTDFNIKTLSKKLEKFYLELRKK